MIKPLSTPYSILALMDKLDPLLLNHCQLCGASLHSRRWWSDTDSDKKTAPDKNTDTKKDSDSSHSLQLPLVRARLLCLACSKDFQRPSLRCRYCDIPLSSETPALTLTNTLICGECVSSTPSFDHCHSLIDYHYPLNQLIHAVKSRGHALHTRALSRLLAQTLREAHNDPIKQLKPTQTRVSDYPTLPTLLLPVPQSRQRFQQRQFNPTRTIAKQLSHELKIAVDYQLLRQIKDSNKQKDLNARQRQINLRGVFAIIEQYKHKLRPHQHVAIVDDVITTGATGKVIATLLKQHGVERVSLWALARTPKPGFFETST